MASVSSTTQSSGLTALQAVVQPATTTAAAADGGTNTADATQDRFLKMLVAQMKNQDPMNPLDNAQVTSQLAQISTVQGVEKLNSTLSKFAEQTGTTRVADSAGLIGQNVLAAGSGFTRTEGQTGATRVGVELAAAADLVKVELLDGSGNAIAARNFSKQPAGTLNFEWPATGTDGKPLAAGKYSMRVTATAAGASVAASTLVAQTVAGITQASGGVGLLLADGGSVAANEIKGVFRP